MSWFTFAILSAFTASLASIIEKRTLRDVHAIDFSVAIAFVSAIASAPVLFVSDWSTLTPVILGVIVFVSAFATFAFIGVTRGIRHLDISTSSSLFLLGPFISTFLAFVLLGETLSAPQFGGIILLAIGLYVLETRHLSRFREFWRNTTGDRYTRYIVYGLVLYGFCAIGDRIALGYRHFDAMFYTALVQAALAFWFSLVALHYRGSVRVPIRAALPHWRTFLLIGLLTTSYRYLQAEATALAAIGLVIAVKRSSSLFTTVIGGELFRERDLIRKSLACAIMIGGVYLIALY